MSSAAMHGALSLAPTESLEGCGRHLGALVRSAQVIQGVTWRRRFIILKEGKVGGADVVGWEEMYLFNPGR